MAASINDKVYVAKAGSLNSNRIVSIEAEVFSEKLVANSEYLVLKFEKNGDKRRLKDKNGTTYLGVSSDKKLQF